MVFILWYDGYDRTYHRTMIQKAIVPSPEKGIVPWSKRNEKTMKNHATIAVHNFWWLTPFSTILVPLESWHSQLSNGTKIVENGVDHQKLWTIVGGAFPASISADSIPKTNILFLVN